MQQSELEALIAIDVCGSTQVTQELGQANGIRKITAAIQQVEVALRAVDNNLRRSYGVAGDAVLLLGGRESVEIYFAASDHQARFKDRDYGRLAIKIALHHGTYVVETDGEGRKSYYGEDLNYLHRMLEYCPHGGTVISPPYFGLMHDAGYGHRFAPVRERFRGYDGEQLFYESRYAYQIPLDSRQPVDRRRAAQQLLDDAAAASIPKRHWWQW